jgi:hypothetical protein
VLVQESTQLGGLGLKGLQFLEGHAGRILRLADVRCSPIVGTIIENASDYAEKTRKC